MLVVEDAEDCGATLEVALHSLADVCLASTAEEALLMLTRMKISALITDLHLPAMDGFELVAKVRSLAGYSKLPILVISGDADPATPARVLRLGANAFFPKPYSPGAVRQKLEQLMNGT